MKLDRLSESLTFRLALLYMVLFTASTAVLLGGAFWASVQAPLQRVSPGWQSRHCPPMHRCPLAQARAQGNASDAVQSGRNATAALEEAKRAAARARPAANSKPRRARPRSGSCPNSN